MGYGNWGRTPYEVQRDNGKRFTFDTIAKHYEEVKPIRGQRAKYNIKPVSERRRQWERMFKVSDNEYYISCNAWSHNENDNTLKHRKAISFLKSGDVETIIVHTPRVYWGAQDNNIETRLNVSALSNPSIYYFYAFNLPIGLTMSKYKTANYVQMATETGDKFYTIEKGDITFTRKVGEKYWSPLVVFRESVHTIDRKLSKVVREKAKDFVEYCRVMASITPDPEHNWWARQTNPFALTAVHGNKYHDIRDNLPKDTAWEALLTKGEDVPTYWFDMMSIYKQRSSIHYWEHTTRSYKTEYNGAKMDKQIYKDLYTVAKPCKETEIPLGERCKDNYGSWFN